MKTITVTVDDEKINEFLSKLEEFIDNNCESDKCITIFGLSVKEYKKILRNTKKQ